jgi:hypothetical protein
MMKSVQDFKNCVCGDISTSVFEPRFRGGSRCLSHGGALSYGTHENKTSDITCCCARIIQSRLRNEVVYHCIGDVARELVRSGKRVTGSIKVNHRWSFKDTKARFFFTFDDTKSIYPGPCCDQGTLPSSRFGFQPPPLGGACVKASPILQGRGMNSNTVTTFVTRFRTISCI